MEVPDIGSELRTDKSKGHRKEREVKTVMVYQAKDVAALIIAVALFVVILGCVALQWILDTVPRVWRRIKSFFKKGAAE